MDIAYFYWTGEVTTIFRERQRPLAMQIWWNYLDLSARLPKQLGLMQGPHIYVLSRCSKNIPWLFLLRWQMFRLLHDALALIWPVGWVPYLGPFKAGHKRSTGQSAPTLRAAAKELHLVVLNNQHGYCFETLPRSSDAIVDIGGALVVANKQRRYHDSPGPPYNCLS